MCTVTDGRLQMRCHDTLISCHITLPVDYFLLPTTAIFFFNVKSWPCIQLRLCPFYWSFFCSVIAEPWLLFQQTAMDVFLRFSTLIQIRSTFPLHPNQEYFSTPSKSGVLFHLIQIRSTFSPYPNQEYFSTSSKSGVLFHLIQIRSTRWISLIQLYICWQVCLQPIPEMLNLRHTWR